MKPRPWRFGKRDCTVRDGRLIRWPTPPRAPDAARDAALVSVEGVLVAVPNTVDAVREYVEVVRQLSLG